MFKPKAVNHAKLFSAIFVVHDLRVSHVHQETTNISLCVR